MFGKVVEGEMQLNEYGDIVVDCWLDLPKHYSNIESDYYVIMPNHMHGIITILVGAGLKPAPTRPLSEIVRGLKTFSSRAINTLRGAPGKPVWQRNYYERIIRNEESLNRIREYIATNPWRWDLDRENPQAKGKDDFDRWLAAFPKPKMRIDQNGRGNPE
ncbi:MAG: transposase [Thermodesulfobacteriota bacterium]